MTASRARVVAIGAALSAVFLALTFRKVSLAGLGAALGEVSWHLAPLAIGLKLAGLGLMAKRSQVLLAGARATPLSALFRSVLVAFVGNTLLPLRVGEVLRAAYLARTSAVPASTSAAMILVEKLLDLALLLLLALALALGALLDLPRGGALLWLSVAAAAGGAALLALARAPERGAALLRRLLAPLRFLPLEWILATYEQFTRGLAALARPGRAASALALSAGYWATTILSIQIWLAAFGLDLPWYAPLVVLVFLGLGTLLPAAPGWIGTYHYFAAAGLAVFGVAPAVAASFALVLHAMATVPATLVGIAALSGDLVSILPTVSRRAVRSDPARTCRSAAEDAR